MSPRSDVRPFEVVPAEELDRATGGAFNWGSLAQSLLQNVMGQIGSGGAAAAAPQAAAGGAAPAPAAGGMGGSPIAGILGSFMGMLGKGGAG